MAERETDQSNISHTATKFCSMEFEDMREADARTDPNSSSRKNLLEEKKPARRPRVTLDGPYSIHFTVDTPPLCSQKDQCQNLRARCSEKSGSLTCSYTNYMASSKKGEHAAKETGEKSQPYISFNELDNILHGDHPTCFQTSNSSNPKNLLEEKKPARRPRITLDGPYSIHFTVDTPPLCSQKDQCQNLMARCSEKSGSLTCSYTNYMASKKNKNATTETDKKPEPYISFNVLDSVPNRDSPHCLQTSEHSSHDTDFSLCELGKTNFAEDQRMAVVRPGSNAEQDEEDASLGDPDAVIKHPLQNSWAMWFFKNDKSRDWKDNLRVITTFDTVEDFWGLYNHTLPASKLQSGCDYSVFKAGIQPMWEDAQNKRGGRWLINLNKSQRQPHLDDLWLETLLCLIGEGFDEYSDDICGATVNIRTKGDKLGLWTRDASRNDATKKIGLKLKESLNVPPKIVIGFQAHSDTAGKAGSTVKNRFTV